MKILYECEVCRHRYDSEAKAVACESKPAPGPAPVGLILTRGYNGQSGGVFAALCTGELEREGHWHRHLTHWFRGNGCGDDTLPRSDILEGDWNRGDDTDMTAASAQRALKRCRSLGWAPLVRRGGAVVPLDTDDGVSRLTAGYEADCSPRGAGS
jgi:hypothetical protein